MHALFHLLTCLPRSWRVAVQAAVVMRAHRSLLGSRRAKVAIPVMKRAFAFVT